MRCGVDVRWSSVAGVSMVLAAVGGCAHGDDRRLLMYEAASYEGGYEIAAVQQRVWNRDPICSDIDFDDNEMWIVWSHLANAEDYSIDFLIGERIAPDEVYLAAAEDGDRVYYSFGDVAEIADRVGNVEANLGEGMRSAAFRPGYDLLAVEGPDNLVLIDMDDHNDRTDLAVSGSGPSWSPDGEWLTYEREGEVLLYSLGSGEERSLGDGVHPRFIDAGSVATWTDGAAGTGIYLIDPETGDRDFAGDADPAMLAAPWWRLAPDGQRVIVDDGEGGFRLQDWSGPDDGDWTLTSDLFCG